ncbi:hypothetical protein AGMMS49942_19620 [Spirochaetia bacterium]|nr:hypothetical protein AGMMS49942_19620 [Spirochaetia bacterium]
MYLTPTLLKCEYCQGQDGKEKGIYKTRQDAVARAQFIKNDRGLVLIAYPCPRGNGFHLTKCDDASDIDIPRKSTGAIPWEYLEYENRSMPEPRVIPQYGAALVKIECTNNTQEITVSGRIMEIIENINIEKLFQINRENVFARNALKPHLTGVINQITIYSENKMANTIESYTLLLQNTIFTLNTLQRGHMITVIIIGKTINAINKWVCIKGAY